MEVGDYVRTKNGNIRKIEEVIDKEYIDDPDYYVDEVLIDIEQNKREDEIYMRKWLFSEEIVKSSPNIIDLIEVGDYVNGFRVCDSTYGLVIVAPTTDLWEMNSIKDEFKNSDLFVSKVYKLEDIKDDIKSIVTREMFESMEYRIGDE